MSDLINSNPAAAAERTSTLSQLSIIGSSIRIKSNFLLLSILYLLIS